MKTTALIAMILSLAGCIVVPTMPGSLSKTTSKFDGATEIMVSPAFVQTGTFVASIRLGVYRTSKMEPDACVIEAIYEGVENIDGLRFNIDGKFETLSPIDSATRFEQDPRNPGLMSVRRFDASLGLIQRLVEATNAVARMDFDATYLDGNFSLKQAYFAKPAFRKFLTEVKRDSESKSK